MEMLQLRYFYESAMAESISKTAQKYDPDLSENIDKLLSVYPRGSSDIKFAEVLAGEYENDYGSLYSSAYSTLPVVNGENIYCGIIRRWGSL